MAATADTRMSRQTKLTKAKQPMQQGLLMAMSALDRQVSRDVTQRSTPEQDALGVGRCSAINLRVELVSSFIIDAFADGQVNLDSLLILAQAMTKTLGILGSELGEETMGKMRTDCCLDAFRQIIADAERARDTLAYIELS